jgi:endonuclease G
MVTPPAAQAGLFETLSGKVAERLADQQVDHRVLGRQAAADRRGPVLVPGRDGPLAPSGGQGLSACPQLFPRNVPIDVRAINAQWRAVGLCSNQFAVVSSTLSKTPLVVVEKLNRSMLSDAKGEARTDEFYPDPRLARGARAELVDYQSSGFDRGHLASAANQPDQQSMIQSFALSNMVPQDPFNNRKTWAKIESDVRKFARRAQGNVFVFSGPLFRGQQRTIGPGRVWVPSHLFKLVYNEASGRSWAYILPNTADARVEAPIDYGEFVRQTEWQVLGAGGVGASAPRAAHEQ